MIGCDAPSVARRRLRDPEVRRDDDADCQPLTAMCVQCNVVFHVVFVAVAVLAVWLQRFGPRGVALGMLAFISYFIGLFLRLTPDQIPWAALSIAIGTGSGALVRFLALRDRPDREVPRMLRAVRARAERAAEAAVRAAGVPEPEDPRRRRLRRRLLDLSETAAVVDAQLEEDDAGYGAGADRLRQRVFDATLAVEELGDTAVRHGSDGRQHPVVSQALAAFADDAPQRSLAVLRDAASETDGALVPELTRIAEALADVRPPDASAAPEAEPAADGPPGAAGEAPADDAPSSRETLRKPLQVAVAMAVAIILGELVSSQRWYWAVIGAFVVFTRADTAGQSLVRAWQRILGTTLGAAAGIALGSVVGGHAPVEVGVLVVAAFTAMYVMPISHTLAMFSITTMLAVLFGLLGTFSDGLLELRVLETLIGGTVGGLAATLILPIRTGDKAREATDTALSALEDLLRDLGARPSDRDRVAHADLLAAARAVQEGAQTARHGAAPHPPASRPGL